MTRTALVLVVLLLAMACSSSDNGTQGDVAADSGLPDSGVGDVAAGDLASDMSTSDLPSDTGVSGDGGTSMCGNGSCDEGETETDCPADCSEQCVAEGQLTLDWLACCDELTMAYNDLVPHQGSCDFINCRAPHCVGPVCIRCGDGVCGPGENYCTCADDCGTLQCVPEGGVAMTREELGTDCCADLDVVTFYDETFAILYACVDCGNGACERYETVQNCPADCVAD